MVRKIPGKVPDDRADEIIMQMFDFRVGGQEMVNA